MENASEWVRWVLPNANDSFPSIARFLLEGDFPNFANTLHDIIISCFSYFDAHGTNSGKTLEAFYRVFELGILVSARDSGYNIESNRGEAESGQLGLVFCPQQHLPLTSLGIIIEFNVAGETEEVHAVARHALKQIRERNYRARVGDFGNVCEVGVGLKGDSCFVVGKRLKQIDGVWKVVTNV
ncbi:hypothetical protein HDU81_009242 [Chytriomyces hyalinus]|nr:hypothetical protein HDU81_009242 [Chytriomyces hyalinus]